MYEVTYRLNETVSMSKNITNSLNFTINSEVKARVDVTVRAYTTMGPGPFAVTAPHIILSSREPQF